MLAAMSDWLTPPEWQALWLTLKVASLATLVSLPMSIFIAHALTRWNFFGKSALNIIVHLPLILPPVVTGYILLIALGRNGVIGGFLYKSFGIEIAFNWTGAAIAAAVMAFPLFVRAIRLSMEGVDPKLQDAAQTLGASRFWIFLTIDLPLILPGIIAGGALAFAKAMGEFGATITFAGNIPGRTQTLPSLIYNNMQTPGGETSATRLVILSIVIASLALIISEIMSRRTQNRLRDR